MKRHDGLWSELVSWPNLLLAAKKARRGKRDREVVRRFEFRRERELLRLQQDLLGGEFQPGAYTTHWITRPKPRLISAAPYRDRVLHHAILNVIEPILERHFHPDSYACRLGKGTHAAARRLQHFLARFPYNAQCDVRKFFPSIDHAILKDLFRRPFKDRPLLTLLDRIVDGANEQEPVYFYFPGDDLFDPFRRRRGLPIGNLTSQWFANWYLTGLDHWVTAGRGVGGYVRYCDDFVLPDRDRGRLRDLMPELTERLAGLRLAPHGDRLQPAPSRAGRTFVGYRLTGGRLRLPNRAVRAFWKRFRWMRREFGEGRLTPFEVQQRLMAWVGHASPADSLPLLERIRKALVVHEGRFVRFQAEASDFHEPRP